MKKFSIKCLWDFVNRVEVSYPIQTRNRANKAFDVLCKQNNIYGSQNEDDFDSMFDTIACIVRESYHR